MPASMTAFANPFPDGGSRCDRRHWAPRGPFRAARVGARLRYHEWIYDIARQAVPIASFQFSNVGNFSAMNGGDTAIG